MTSKTSLRTEKEKERFCKNYAEGNGIVGVIENSAITVISTMKGGKG